MIPLSLRVLCLDKYYRINLECMQDIFFGGFIRPPVIKFLVETDGGEHSYVTKEFLHITQLNKFT